MARAHHKPLFFTDREFQAFPGSPDPAEVTAVAHESAAVLVGAGRVNDDPQVTQRLVALTDEIGLSTVAELWSGRPAVSLPGAMWRLYTLREWVRRDPDEASADYTAGVRHAQVSHVVAGSADPNGPVEIRQLVDRILEGAFTGDFAVALERAAAFCRVVASGRAERAERHDGHDDIRANAEARSAALLGDTASDLTKAAAAWRIGALD